MSMIKSSILVRNLDIAQLSVSLIKSVNRLLAENPYMDTIVYYQHWGRLPIPPRFGMLMEREVWGSSGACIATDLKTAEKLGRCPGDLKKFFYVWNLEWLQYGGDYTTINNIYQNPEIELVARSEYHAEIIEKVWKKPAYIMNDFDPEVLKKILYDSQL